LCYVQSDARYRLGLMSALPYYKSLDGIRGIAVLMVVLIHSRLMPIGWVGVQAFFVGL